ncbi:rhodanese-like domain-containing protein, partial [Streptococcus pneumoniae]|uniref:rhodanese-like domain-containing protein n=1 Tax=Streptococcus pneumoniae TaxID=1313 RepID=UPI001454DAB6
VEVALEEGSHLLLDVREQDEWDAGHVEGSVFLPMSQLMARIQEVPSDKPVYLICHSGQRSLYAAQWLEQAGHEAPKSVAGGIEAWARSGKEIVG